MMHMNHKPNDCGCGYRDVRHNPAPCEMPACVQTRIYRGVAPKCPIEASIPLIEVATDMDIQTLSNCFVHVLSTNKTFYIDSKHRFILCWSGDLYLDDYDISKNPLNLRAQTVVDFKNGKLIYYNNTGDAMVFEGGTVIPKEG